MCPASSAPFTRGCTEGWGDAGASLTASAGIWGNWAGQRGHWGSFRARAWWAAPEDDADAEGLSGGLDLRVASWLWRPLQELVACVGQTETSQSVIPDWLLIYGSVTTPKPPTSDNQTQLPFLASLVWEPSADRHFLVSCLSVAQSSPLIPGASPPAGSPTSKSPSISQGLRGTGGALLVDTCYLSCAPPRDELENVLLAVGEICYPGRGWERRTVSWPGLYPPSLHLWRDSGCSARSMALGGQSLLKANAKCQAASMQQRLCRWGCWREGRW